VNWRGLLGAGLRIIREVSAAPQPPSGRHSVRSYATVPCAVVVRQCRTAPTVAADLADDLLCVDCRDSGKDAVWWRCRWEHVCEVYGERLEAASNCLEGKGFKSLEGMERRIFFIARLSGRDEGKGKGSPS
jgi:hypothetical protein